MNPPTRKIAVGFFIGLLVVFAGCNAFQTGSTPANTMHLVNQDGTGHAVVVEISYEEELVYSAGRTLDAESETQLESFGENGEYQVAVTVDGNTTMKSYAFPGDDSTTTIGIDNDGVVTIST